MKAFFRRGRGVAVALLGLAIAATAPAQLLFYGEIYPSPTNHGSFVHWAPVYWNENPGAFESSTAFNVGEGWAFANQYDVHRAYMIFDLPDFSGVITREEAGIPDALFPEITTLRAEVISARLGFPAATINYESTGQPFDFRLTSLSAADLVDGTLDPAAAFAGLGQGVQILDDELFYVSDAPSSAGLNQAFLNALNHGNGDPFVLSFTLPNDQHSYPIISYAGEFSLTVGYNAYPPFSAVPEPSTYGLAAAALCTLALWRRRRSAVR